MTSRLAAIGTEFPPLGILNSLYDVDLVAVGPSDRLEHRLRNVCIHGVLVATAGLSAADVAALSAVLQFPTLPLIFWGKVTPECFAFVRELAKYANPRLFLEHYEDVQSVTQFINDRSPTREHLLFRAAIEGTMAKLPTRVRLNLEMGLRELPVRNAVEVLAARAGRSERWVLDKMHAAGFSNTHSVFLGPRIIDAWCFAQDGGYHNVDIARKSGYASVEGLLHLINCIDVKSLTDLAALSSEEVIAEVTSKVLRN